MPKRTKQLNTIPTVLSVESMACAMITMMWIKTTSLLCNTDKNDGNRLKITSEYATRSVGTTVCVRDARRIAHHVSRI